MSLLPDCENRWIVCSSTENSCCVHIAALIHFQLLIPGIRGYKAMFRVKSVRTQNNGYAALLSAAQTCKRCLRVQ